MLTPVRFRTYAALLLGAWLIAWLIAFPNAYGWHFDDTEEFTRFYAAPISDLIRPPFFNVYVWFIAPVPIALHNLFGAGIPSLPMGRGMSVEVSRYLRLVMAWTLTVQTAALAILPFFLLRVLKAPGVALFAFAGFLLSPPLNFWAVNVDDRLLGLIAALPALWIAYAIADGRDAVRVPLWPAVASGALLCAGQSIHYTCLYFGVPWIIACFAYVGFAHPRRALAVSAAFLAGVGAVLAVFELVFRLVPGVPYLDPVMFLFHQNTAHQATYDAGLKAAVWLESFVTLMGLPMMVLVVGGVVICFVPALRPRWLTDTAAMVLGITVALVAAYLLLTPAIGFYRQTSCLQIAFAALAAIAIARVAGLLPGRYRPAVSAALAIVAFWTPAVESYANYQSNQGLGRALHVAYGSPRFKSVTLFTWLSTPPANGLGAIGPDEALITLMPHALLTDPTTLGLLHDTPPLGAFFAQQCTDESYLEGAGLNVFRHFNREPEMCEARVYSGADIVRERNAPPLPVVGASADYSYSGFTPDRTIGTSTSTSIDVGWMSGDGPTHYLDLQFARTERLDGLTIVPPDYIGYGDRIDNLAVWGADSKSGTLQRLFAASSLDDHAVISATWPVRPILRLRIQVAHSPGRWPWLRRPNYPTDIVGIRKLLVPHRTLVWAPKAKSL